MIARLSGKLLETGDGWIVVDAGGVGYLVHVSGATLASLGPRGEAVSLRIHTHVREDALDLFGFSGEDEEAVFHALLQVKGVGPRGALNILSGIEARELAQAVAGGDVVRLTKVPGVGKKTAERLVVELKDKLLALAKAAGGKARAVPEADALEQLAAALVNLGYKPPQAESAVESLRDEAEGKALDVLLREALKRLRG